ncbi:DEAD/DEAH box helicase [Aerosakkonema sp. BLCC-F2]
MLKAIDRTVFCIYNLMLTTPLTTKLREYQIEWIQDIFDAWSQGSRYVLAQLPCGAGKTICFAYICREFFKKSQNVLVIAHRIELINQAASKLEKAVGVPVGIIKAGMKADPSCQIQVASIQTLIRRKELPTNIGLVVFDEAHHVTASSYRQLIEHYKESLILGVTATPKRIDGQGFENLFDRLILGVSTEKLIAAGYLSKFRLFATDKTISTYGVAKNERDFNSRDLALAVTTQVGVDEIVQNYLKYAANKRTIIYAASVQHSKDIAKALRASHIQAEHLDGDTPIKTRFEILKRFEKGSTKIITNYEILTEGYDCENIECIYCLRPTESLTLWLQMVGRGLRVSENKSTAIIIDVTDNWNKHGLPDDNFEWTLQATPPPTNHIGLKKCEFCSHIFRPLTEELKVIEAEIDKDGYIIRHYRATCPGCGSDVPFSTKEREGKNHQRVRVRLTVGRQTELVELNLNSTPSIIKQVYHFVKTQPSISTPDKIYKAIFRQFIKIIDDFSLGDWRRIVKLVEPTHTIPTKIAWELYLEGKLKHQNRLAALEAMSKRKSLEQQKLTSQPPQPPQPAQKIVALQQKTKGLPAVGNPDIRKKYARQWKLFLSRCHSSTAEFLRENAGLFSVEDSDTYCNISIELRNVPELKTQRLHLKEAEFLAALSEVFGKKASIMFRLQM